MLNNHKVGVALGSSLGTLHAVWSLLVAMGWARPVLDFIYGLHFMNNPMTFQPFSIGTAVLLVLVTSLVGYGFGWMFSYFWNRLHQA
jgi:hypothetical protein